MADYGFAISPPRELSHTSDDSSADLSPRISTETPASDYHRVQLSHAQQTRKVRGRPPGAKNKPKPPIIIVRDGDSAMKPAILEISAGSDVIETIIRFAHRNHVGLSVISATGSVSDVTLRNHALRPFPTLSLHGPFTLLALSGSFVGSSTAIRSGRPPPPPPSSFPVHACSFGISLAGPQGQVFGGIVAGKVVAATQITVVAATFLNPTIHMLPAENINEANRDIIDVSTSLSGGCGDASTPTGASERSASNGMPMSAYGVACQTSPMESSPDIMHWGHPPSHSSY